MTALDSPLLERLNPPQRAAVTTTDGPLLVISGAGTGKTRVVTHRIAYLIEEKKIAPWRIFASTFTNKAAREMAGRIDHLCRTSDTARLPIATFHSHCARILRSESKAAGLTPRYSICDETDQAAVVRDCLRELGHDPKLMTVGDLLSVISLAKMKLLEGDSAEVYIESLRSAEYAEVYRLYQHRLRSSDAVDFDDLLLLVVKIWREDADILRIYQDRYPYIMVDEYQDTNMAQFEFLRLLSAKYRNLCVVGDEDQSIYSWRGAEITNLLEFQRHFPEAQIIRLEQNYRSTGSILAAADAVIARNQQRLGKTLWTESEQGDPIVVLDALSDRDEARIIANEMLRLYQQGIALQEIALFYRINALSRLYEDALRELNLPYRVIGGVRFYDRAEIKDILSYLQVVENPNNTLSLLRIINRPRRGLGDTALSKILAYADAQKITVFEVLIDSEKLAAAGIKGKTARGALDLGERLLEWAGRKAKWPLKKLVADILSKTDYEASLGDPRSIEVLARLENIKEFQNAIAEYQDQQPEAALAGFLESIALRSVDKEEGADNRGISLMTVHNAKGLEFDVVFVAALEDEVFPNARAVREQGSVEEERRLFYVAMTRGRKRVYLSFANMRKLYNQAVWPTPSAFIHEIPQSMRVAYEEADLPNLVPTEERLPKSDSTLAEANEEAGLSHKSRLFRHDMLGPVEIIGESGSGHDKRIVVRDAAGREHTLLAVHAGLRPLDSEEHTAKASPKHLDEDMPF